MAMDRQNPKYTTFKIFTVVLYLAFSETNFARAKIFPSAKSLEDECHFCDSEECLYQANMLVKHINPSIHPCEDFYSFACGGFLERFGKEDTGFLQDDTWDNFLITLKNMLDNLKPNSGTVSEKLKVVYDNCMDKESSEIKAVPDALDFLSNVGIPNWPGLDSDFQFVQLGETLGSLSAYREFAFITFQPSPYEWKSGVTQFPSPLISPDKYLLDSKLNPKHIEGAILKILSYVGFDEESSETLWESFKSIENYGIKLLNDETTNNAACSTASSRQFIKINCSVETQGSMAFLCNVWKAAVQRGDLNKYYSTETLHISCRLNHYNYIEKIFSYLDTLNQRSLAHYLSLRFFMSHLDDLNLYFQLIKKGFNSPKEVDELNTDAVNRIEYCIGWIMKSMHLALGYEYTQIFMKEQVEKDVLDIVQNYVAEISNSIDKQKWINEEDKLHVKKEMEKLNIRFRKSIENFRNETMVANFYEEFPTVIGRSFLKNILEYRKYAVFAKKEKTDFNSFYSFSLSEADFVDIGFTPLLPPRYTYGLPKVWNHAGFGWLLGHELSHNLKYFFDVVQVNKATETSLKDKLACYFNQYNQFIVEETGKNVTSMEIEEEIACDNIGWELTEKLMETFSGSDVDIYLPGLEYSPLQITYISFAQQFCAVLNNQDEKEFYDSRVHDIDKLRVLSIMQNSKTFSKVFNCSTEQPMNPSTKCLFFE